MKSILPSSTRKDLLGESDSELVSSKWIPCRDSMHWVQGTGTLNGRVTDKLLISRPNIVLLLDCLLSELLVRCSNCSILDVTEEEGRNWRRAMLVLLLLRRGARNHSGSWCSIDNRINVASTQALLLKPARQPAGSLHSIFPNPHCVVEFKVTVQVD